MCLLCRQACRDDTRCVCCVARRVEMTLDVFVVSPGV